MQKIYIYSFVDELHSTQHKKLKKKNMEFRSTSLKEVWSIYLFIFKRSTATR